MEGEYICILDHLCFLSTLVAISKTHPEGCNSDMPTSYDDSCSTYQIYVSKSRCLMTMGQRNESVEGAKWANGRK